MGVRRTNAEKWDSGVRKAVEETLTVEAPLQILINGKTFTVTLRTPGDDENLARGLLFSEGIWSGREEVGVEIRGPDEVNVLLATHQFLRAPDSNRALASSASCGICGKVDLSGAELTGGPLTRGFRFPLSRLPELYARLASSQTLFGLTGGCHAAGIFSSDGDCLGVAEDVGRHNAVDKVIGKMLQTGRLPEGGLMLVSGRASYEILLKAFRAEIPAVVAVSAVSTLAVEVAREKSLALLGFCREGRATIYSGGCVQWER